MDDWKKLLGTVAPLVGSAFGGPLGGVAASFVADKLGLSEKTVAAVTDAIQGGKLDPAQVAQLKLAEIEFQKFLKQNDIDIEKVHAADRNSARDMLKATGSYVPSSLTFIIVVAVLGLEGSMILNGTPQGIDQLVLGRIMGTLDMALGLVLAFWFGTTRNSQDKTQLLANSAPAK
jgi:hypothetical protein